MGAGVAISMLIVNSLSFTRTLTFPRQVMLELGNAKANAILEALPPPPCMGENSVVLCTTLKFLQCLYLHFGQIPIERRARSGTLRLYSVISLLHCVSLLSLFHEIQLELLVTQPTGSVGSTS